MIEQLNPNLAELCEQQFSRIGWSKPAGRFLDYYQQQNRSETLVFVAHQLNNYQGHVRIVWKPGYPHFRDNNIPEIQDLNVLPDYRKQGFGTALINTCEQVICENHAIVGIGVGLHHGYNNAQRLYPRLGYIPDGHGVHYNNKPVKTGDSYRFDDDLVLYFTKNLNDYHS